MRVVDGVVMAHPAREDMAFEVCGRADLGGIVWDNGAGRWDTGRRCLLQGVGSASDWWLVVQDDAVLPRRFLDGAARALDYVRHGENALAPVSFYVGAAQPFRTAVLRGVRQRIRDASSAGRGNATPAWLHMPELNWGVAVAFPTRLLQEIVQAGDRHPNRNYDARAGAYFTERNTPIWYTWPSLVDHHEGPSLIPGRTAKRRALRFIGVDADAARINWAGDYVTINTRRLHHDAAAVGP